MSLNKPVKRGEEILKKIPRTEYQDNGETVVDYEVLKIFLKDKVVVPEEKWLKIKTLIENYPEEKKIKFAYSGGAGSLREERIDKWYEELSKEMEG